MNFLKAKDYQKHAKIQNLMALKLCLKLKHFKQKHFKKVFEFGCGRGEFTQKLEKIISFDEYLKNDILDYGIDLKVQIFDMNKLAMHHLSKEKFDLIASNATLQWLDLEHILPTLFNMLNQEGILLLSTFGKQNLKEIKQSTGFSLKYFNIYTLRQIFKKYFSNVKITEEIISLDFNNALEVFKHLKLSGVNSLGFYRLNKQFLQDYEKKFQNKLTYHPIYILCQKDMP
ncbi:methyltransferase domain-containing protein [Campylobacter hepaticus]|uniref:Methyltransferase domain-containing protein n=1 Tax=Campylobacter hepaticus TaxID=1813019 RepID=A0A424Z344_9BACT|nr:methyltransferase domain-containing protein [Campylobacter hepaticus]RQD68771.1 methyltransferase domain-containing protein [Campylobacter hepaticus]RQD88726.1 methyltransferase domain-containing protein [Campylobacter hepaticus]